MAKVCRTKKRDKAKEKQAEKKNEKAGPGPAKPNIHSLLNVIASDDESNASPLCCYFGAPENRLVDSGATDHMTPFGSDITNYVSFANSTQTVILGNSITLGAKVPGNR